MEKVMITFEHFPKQPGVYLFKDKEHQIIYIGKATSLRDRVHSYFSKEQQNDLKIHTLLEEHESIDYIATQTEMEASLLEAHLIYKHQPKYNVLLKNGQPFLYILFTNETLPKMEIVRNKKKKGTYFGPFLHKMKARSVYTFLTKTFRLNLCNKKIEHGCLAYHIGTCAGNCRSDFDASDYQLRLQLAMDVLKDNDKAYIKKIEEQIEIYSNELAFEKAQHLHEYLTNFDHIFKTIRLRFSPSKYTTDIFVALNHFDQFNNSVRILRQAPDFAKASTGTQDRLQGKRNEKKEPSPTVELKEPNIDIHLQEFLGLSKPINTVDCFDISHFQSNSLVGSCVRFTHGLPDKNKFRRFMIRTIDKQNDYAALQEIVTRRYKEKQDLPDLILIDGGKGQLNAIKDLVPETTCISLAKKEERLFGPLFPDGIHLDVKTDVGKLLIALRDYAHHFAISYHRIRRKKEL